MSLRKRISTNVAPPAVNPRSAPRDKVVKAAEALNPATTNQAMRISASAANARARATKPASS